MSPMKPCVMNANVPANLELVVKPYEGSTSPPRQGVMIRGVWNEEATAFVNDNNIEAVFSNVARGSKGTDFSFLSELQRVKQVHIIANEGTGLAGVEDMPQLEDLSLNVHTSDKVDFTKIKTLRKVFLGWWKQADSILDCAWLEELSIDSFKYSNLDRLRNLKNLKALQIGNSSIKTLDWLEDFERLERLELHNCKKVEDFTVISRCKALRRLDLHGCKNVSDLEFIAHLERLEELDLSSCGEIQSVAPLENVKTLKAFAFNGSTNVLDGDLGVLESLPKLAMLMFVPRRHYSHKLIKPWSWKNFNSPDALLERKP